MTVKIYFNEDYVAVNASSYKREIVSYAQQEPRITVTLVLDEYTDATLNELAEYTSSICTKLEVLNGNDIIATVNTATTIRELVDAIDVLNVDEGPVRNVNITFEYANNS